MAERDERAIICPLSLSLGGRVEYSTLGLESLALRRIKRLTGSTETSSNIQLVWLHIWREEKGGIVREKEEDRRKGQRLQSLPSIIYLSNVI